MKYVLLIAITGLLLIAIRWPLVPSHRLPRHRVRHMRIRIRLRLHPGRGHATAFELWLRWGRLAVFRGSARSRPSMTFWRRLTAPSSAYSLAVGRGHHRHRLRLPLEEHAVVQSSSSALLSHGDSQECAKKLATPPIRPAWPASNGASIPPRPSPKPSTLPTRHLHLCPQHLLPAHGAAVAPCISNRIKQSHPAAMVVIRLRYLQADAVRRNADRYGV